MPTAACDRWITTEGMMIDRWAALNEQLRRELDEDARAMFERVSWYSRIADAWWMLCGLVGIMYHDGRRRHWR